MNVAILAGGVGGARFVRAAVAALGPEAVTVIVNTGDDERFHGLFVSPDLDSVLYTLAGENDARRGWGLSEETFRAFEALRRFDPQAWFQLGDRDLGTHLFRTQVLAGGGTLAEATRSIATALGVRATVLPMSDQPVRTLIETDRGTLTFQQFHVRERSQPLVRSVRYDGGESARPSPGVLEALAQADVILVAPSNPVSSIAPILAVPAIRSALVNAARPIVGLSGIRGGAPFRGDADRFLTGLGVEVSPVGVARLYRGWVHGLVIDDLDVALAPSIGALGPRVATCDTALDPLERGIAAVERCVELATRCAPTGR
ncbi:MAG: 2-phospho-L-lactate transferase [Deltaproteobacteria bacterium]|nr:2-phospho-L-lactate transferase [Deltaproteobacteria bacterium]